jgi:NADH-quinone oxidoreductase subunit J
VAYYVFLVLAIAAIVFGWMVVLGRNPAICAVNLVGAFFCLSGIYLLIGFPFLAALQLIVYAGAIMVLFIFVIMLLDLKKEQAAERPIGIILAPITAGLLLATLAFGLGGDGLAEFGKNTGLLPPIGGEASATGGPELSRALFSRHVLAFEATSLLLLGAIVGVIVFAKKQASREDLMAVGASAEKLPSDARPNAGAKS